MSALPYTLVYNGNQIEWQACSMYDDHRHPMTEQHHVCPESWWRAAGKPVSSPLLTLCPNCHYGVHVCIDALLAGHDVSLMYASWVACAKQAFVLATANGLTPARTL